MKILIPSSSFLLSLIALFLKKLQMSIDAKLSILHSIDAVSQQLRLEINSISHQLYILVVCIAILSFVIAVVSIYNKLCNKIIGATLLLVAFFSFLCALVRL